MTLSSRSFERDPHSTGRARSRSAGEHSRHPHAIRGSDILAASEDRDRRSFDFSAIRIRLASPETIRRWSRGEVTKPETINYRTFRPERDGLFCERIFGPVKDWECSCGKYKRIRYKGVVCDRCGVEVTRSRVRRERLGHIELAVPVSHIWYFKASPSRIGLLLDLTIRELERVLYYESYIVLDPGQTELEFKQLITEEEYADLEREYGPGAFVAEMGAGAVKRLLASINVEDLAAELRSQIRVETSVQRKKHALKRLRAVEALRHSGNRPEWMVLAVVPVAPGSQASCPLEGGRFRHQRSERSVSPRHQQEQPAEEASRPQGARGHSSKREADAPGGRGRPVRQRTQVPGDHGAEESPPEVPLRRAHGQAGAFPSESPWQASGLLGAVGHRRSDQSCV